MIYTEVSEIPLFSYSLIMADVPWSFDNYSAKGEAKNAKSQYDCMTLEDICALPVGQLASKNCILWLWATNPLLDKAFDVLSAWGFQFKTAGTWVKMSSSWTSDMWKDGREPKMHFGTGYVLRSANEPFLIGTMGKTVTSRSVRSVVQAAIREHSRKPEECYAAAEMLVPNAKRLDLFSRQERDGWDCFGDEADKFKKHKTDLELPPDS